MTICFASDFLPEYHKIWGGAEQAAYRYAKLLAGKGHKVEILTTTPSKFKSEEDQNIGVINVPVLADYLGILGDGLTFVLPFDPLSFIFSFRALRKIKPSLLHLHRFRRLSFSLILSAKILKIPVFFSIYDYWSVCPKETLINLRGEPCRLFQSYSCGSCLSKSLNTPLASPVAGPLFYLRRAFFNLFISKIKRHLVLSNSSSNIINSYGIKDVSVVPFPVLGSPEDWQKSTPGKILFVGGIQPRKGLLLVVEALVKLKKKRTDFKLTVVATDIEESYLNDINGVISNNSLEENVEISPKMPFEVVKEHIRESEFIVVAEQWENMSPLILVEAAFLAKPTVASRIGGIPSFIDDGETGLLFEPKDTEEMALRMETLLGNDALSQKMGESAKRKILNIFNEESIFKRLVQSYA